MGTGAYGQLDLLGSVYQWTLDGYVPYVNPCTDCVFFSSEPSSAPG
jgi:hypothetical protein